METKQELAEINKALFDRAKVEVTSTSLTIAEVVTFDEWQQVGRVLGQIEGAIHWWIGDWLRFGEHKWGEKYTQAIDDTGFEYDTLTSDVRVAERIDFGRRRPNLSHSHHKEVAYLEPNAQDYWLEKAEKEGLSTRELRKAIREEKTKGILSPPLPEGKFSLIVIDPPWPYKTVYDNNTRRVASPYPEMALSDIQSLQIPCAENCVLWLWTTHKFLCDAIRILTNWEFEYKLTTVWNKESLGMGRWLRCQVEFCLLGIKGTPDWNLTNERDIITSVRTAHSAKPDEFYAQIEELCPSSARLDMFYGKKRKGWISWGVLHRE